MKINLTQCLELIELFGHPDWLEYMPEELRDEAEEQMDGWLDMFDRELKAHRTSSRPTMDSVHAWRQEPGMEEFATAARIRYLKQQRTEALEALRDNKEAYIDARRVEDIEMLPILQREAERLAKELRRYDRAIYALTTGAKDDITQDMIERAREFPLASLVETNQRGFARCVNHDEKTPSMYTKKNYAHCFGCGFTGDPIDVYMKINGVGFREAVRALAAHV